MFCNKDRQSGSNDHDYEQYVSSYIQPKFRGIGNFIYDPKEQWL